MESPTRTRFSETCVNRAQIVAISTDPDESDSSTLQSLKKKRLNTRMSAWLASKSVPKRRRSAGALFLLSARLI